MTRPKFKAGQSVDFNPSRATIPASILEYKILRMMPHEGNGERQYRIKTIAEAFERIAKESELTTRVRSAGDHIGIESANVERVSVERLTRDVLG